MHVLIVKLGSIGDVIHTLPTLAAMRRGLPPETKISWAVENRAAEILRGNPLLTRLIEIDTKALRQSGEPLRERLNFGWRQFKELRADRYDVALDFQGLHKSALIARLSGAGKTFGFDRAALREPTSRFLLDKTIAVPLQTNVINKNLRLAAEALRINVPRRADEFEFPIAVESRHEREADAAAEKVNSDFAVLNPGGGWTTKQWEPRRFGELADGLWRDFNLPSLVIHAPGEEKLAESVIQTATSRCAVAVCLSLKGLFALLGRARVYVGGDTGPTHLAVAAGAPVVGLFGPTEWWRNGSPNAKDVSIERADISCRTACHRRVCDNWICLDIEVERVLRAVEKRLQSSANSRRGRVGVTETITLA